MFLKQLSLVNYKNIIQKSFDFDAKIICFVGKNGVGKTNVLDAIYHLAYGNSYFNPLSSQNINHEADFFVIDAAITIADKEEKIVCSFKKGQKKVIKRNNKVYEKLSEHIGFIPLVIVSPADRDLITEGSETRRKFIDSIIASINSRYLNELITYQKLVAQRNALLKYFANNQTFDATNLAIYNEQIIPLGEKIHATRITFLEEFEPIFNRFHKKISQNNEKVQLTYTSQLQTDSFETLLQTNLSKDRALQYTSVGIHKDDFVFEIDGHPIKKFGSQGQQKSYLIALKLAQFEFLKKESGHTPILLLDDIFDKLDATRVAEIISLVNDATFGQIFITDTHEERTEDIIKNTDENYCIFTID